VDDLYPKDGLYRSEILDFEVVTKDLLELGDVDSQDHDLTSLSLDIEAGICL
jgi:hypothetical protein